MRSRELRERDGELAVLARVLAGSAAGRGGVAIVEGEAGIGKTALLDAAVAGLPVLRARAGSWSGTSGSGSSGSCSNRCCAGPTLDGTPRCSTARRGRRGRFSGSRGTPVDAFAVQHGLCWLLDALAAEAPVVLVVDDAHWADAASLGWLVYLARFRNTCRCTAGTPTAPRALWSRTASRAGSCPAPRRTAASCSPTPP